MINGHFISVKEKSNTFVLEKEFFLDNKNAKLKITALGLYVCLLNGKRVGDSYYTPGFTSYDKILQMQEYDLSNLVVLGTNKIEITVNGGWYATRLMGPGHWHYYGDAPSVLAEIESNGKTILSTDIDWIAKESFIKFSGIYDGEVQDFISSCNNLTPCIIYYDKNKIVNQMCEPVRNIETLDVVEVFHDKDGIIYDFGQNITGVAEITTPSKFKGTITIKYAEIMVDGTIYTDNLRTAKSTDIFTLEGKRKLVAEFTFHGFRYIKVYGIKLNKKNVKAIVRHTDLTRTGFIETDNIIFNRLLDNVLWGQRDNYLDIPTDCPQRDERMGWTGDANVFCTTASFNYDVRKFFKKWLTNMRLDQNKDGRIPFVVPDTLTDCGTEAMWADSIIMIPYKLYQMYGDITYLTDNYNSMKKYLSAQEKTLIDGLVSVGHQFGDWLALDSELYAQDNFTGRTDIYYIANAFYYHCLKTVEEIANILGDNDYKKECNKKANILLKNIRNKYFTNEGLLAIDTITAHVLALEFNLVQKKYKTQLAEKLNNDVIKHNYHVTTGFIGTSYLLFALANNGYIETAKKVLLVKDMPGWLYELDMGATTIWERWNSLLPDGRPNPDGMNSYNHYAYGAFMEFVYKRIAGIEPICPGFKKVTIAPSYLNGINYVKGTFKSVSGEIVSGYIKNDKQIEYFAIIPKTIKADFYIENELIYKGVNGNISIIKEINANND